MPRKKAFNEHAVLEKAMHLFWKQGYHATSVQDLVDALGINRSSMYETFGDKEALFERSFEHYRTVNQEAIQEFINGFESVKEGLKALFHQAVYDSLRDTDHKGCFVVNTATELLPGDERMEKTLEENRESFETFFLTQLKKGVAQGEIDKGKDLKAIATLLFTLYNGMKVISKLHPEEARMIRMVNAALSVLD